MIAHRDGEDLLTPAGEELRSIVESMGVWGQRWARGDVIAKKYDASLLMWDIHRNVDIAALPASRVVVYFHPQGSSDRKSHFWLVLEALTVDLRLTDLGHDIEAEVDITTMVDDWMGRAGRWVASVLPRRATEPYGGLKRWRPPDCSVAS